MASVCFIYLVQQNICVSEQNFAKVGLLTLKYFNPFLVLISRAPHMWVDSEDI